MISSLHVGQSFCGIQLFRSTWFIIALPSSATISQYVITSVTEGEGKYFTE